MAKKKGPRFVASAAPDLGTSRIMTSLPDHASPGEVLEVLRLVVAERDRLRAREGSLVVRGRALGLTWGALAGVLGVSPQAVQKRYGGRS